ncbi:MAG: metal-dependent hydrolase [Helicobacteraceae bacterium]|jgi:cytosine/adenosine deaminase-related metal-dependent hydrolase|nr:metal-dependent hydrolase [Helicobacteraceae bacterium]
MKIITPETILSPTEQLSGQSIAFDTHIRAIGPLHELLEQFPEAEFVETPLHSMVMPGLINPHVHLEFSGNKSTLKYGSFLEWLYSVIEHRDDLIQGCDEQCMAKACDDMLKNGITTFGAISSYAMDLEVAANAKQKVIFFSEVIGSQATMADTLYDDFMSRFEASQKVQREGFIPAIAIHSPYSVHPALIRRALAHATQHNILTSAHYMESPAEKEWLESNSGAFQPFFKEFLKQEYAVNTSKEFLDLFKGKPTLMTHVVQANDEELRELAEEGHTVIHCPISNRLLGNGAIDLEKLDANSVPWIMGTDGLSSNYALDLMEEMKIALFMHADADLLPLAKELLASATVKSAKALGLNTGEIAVGREADLLVIDLEATPNEQLPLHLLLHGYNIEHIYINGNEVS